MKLLINQGWFIYSYAGFLLPSAEPSQVGTVCCYPTAMPRDRHTPLTRHTCGQVGRARMVRGDQAACPPTATTELVAVPL